jgi:hypothetical protein
MYEVFRRLPDASVHTVLSHGSYQYKNRWASKIVGQDNLCIFGRGLRARLAYWAASTFVHRRTRVAEENLKKEAVE